MHHRVNTSVPASLGQHACEGLAMRRNGFFASHAAGDKGKLGKNTASKRQLVQHTEAEKIYFVVVRMLMEHILISRFQLPCTYLW